MVTDTHKYNFKIVNEAGLELRNTRPDVGWIKDGYTFETFTEVVSYLKDKVDKATGTFLANNTFKNCRIVAVEITEKTIFELNSWF